MVRMFGEEKNAGRDEESVEARRQGSSEIRHFFFLLFGFYFCMFSGNGKCKKILKRVILIFEGCILFSLVLFLSKI